MICDNAPMSEPCPDTHALAARHRRFGWACLGLFALGGLLLETAHGFKVPAIVEHETRRTMWRLAHAHGALLGLLHLAFAAQLAPGIVSDRFDPRAVSHAMQVASVVLPAGFVLGGVWFYEGDPGFGIALVPIGAVALIWACWQLARA